MALIENAKKGRKDGGYTRILGDEDVGALMSRLQAAVISAGTELKKLICTTHTNLMTSDMLTSFLNKKLANGTYLIPKDIIKKYIKVMIGSDSEPDFIIIVIVDKRAYVVEIKDGDTFDTKKSAGEINSCRKFAKLLSEFLLKQGLAYEVSIRICCFNQSEKDKIVKGFKDQILKSEAWTGIDLCKVLGLSYTTINDKRAVDQNKNSDYLVKELFNIKRFRDEFIRIHENTNK